MPIVTQTNLAANYDGSLSFGAIFNVAFFMEKLSVLCVAFMFGKFL